MVCPSARIGLAFHGDPGRIDRLPGKEIFLRRHLFAIVFVTPSGQVGNQPQRKRTVKGNLDGPFAGLVPFQPFCERHDGIRPGIEADMLARRREVNEIPSLPARDVWSRPVSVYSLESLSSWRSSRLPITKIVIFPRLDNLCRRVSRQRSSNTRPLVSTSTAEGSFWGVFVTCGVLQHGGGNVWRPFCSLPRAGRFLRSLRSVEMTR